MTDHGTGMDLGRTGILRLFAKFFFPTLLSEILIATLNIVDGIIVGRGVGSDALAAVNIASPIFLFSTAIALMFASGVSILAAIHLSKGEVRDADIIITQAMTIPQGVMLLLSLAVLLLSRPLCFLFGGSEQLCPLVAEYLRYISPVPFLTCILLTGTFIVRLDGTPDLALVSSAIATFCNIVLDYVFVFPLGMGIKGAAVATSISMFSGSVPIIIYLLFRTKTLHLCFLKPSLTSFYLVVRNICNMARVGVPSFIGEVAMSVLIISGNFMFMGMLHEDGVAAFGVCCYLFPLVLMFGNAIAQSQMPIISYNYGQENWSRVRRTICLSVGAAALFGLLMALGGFFFSATVASLFLDKGTGAFAIAAEGIPLFSISSLFLILNIVIIGCYQSIERTRVSVIFMLLRGIVLIVPIFLLLPRVAGQSGLWLATPLSEFLSFLIICTYVLVNRSAYPRI